VVALHWPELTDAELLFFYAWQEFDKTRRLLFLKVEDNFKVTKWDKTPARFDGYASVRDEDATRLRYLNELVVDVVLHRCYVLRERLVQTTIALIKANHLIPEFSDCRQLVHSGADVREAVSKCIAMQFVVLSNQTKRADALRRIFDLRTESTHIDHFHAYVVRQETSGKPLYCIEFQNDIIVLEASSTVRFTDSDILDGVEALNDLLKWWGECVWSYFRAEAIRLGKDQPEPNSPFAP
jgi:hypothetical protein